MDDCLRYQVVDVFPRKTAKATVRFLDQVFEEFPVAIQRIETDRGQEFKAVAVMACDDEVLPLQDRIETAADEAELEAIFETERHLLYVAVTRARDRVAVTGLEPGSEFIPDLQDER